MDGLARGKPSLADISGVLHNFHGELIGVKDSKKVEVLAILEAIRISSGSLLIIDCRE